MSSGTPDLTAVREAASLAESGRRQLETEIHGARDQGASLRAIAEAAGLAHETVRRIAG
jgi:hypothetical protein